MPSLQTAWPLQSCRLIEEHGADTGLPNLWQSLAGDCPNARSTALNNRCAIYYLQLPALFLASKETHTLPSNTLRACGGHRQCTAPKMITNRAHAGWVRFSRMVNGRNLAQLWRRPSRVAYRSGGWQQNASFWSRGRGGDRRHPGARAAGRGLYRRYRGHSGPNSSAPQRPEIHVGELRPSPARRRRSGDCRSRRRPSWDHEPSEQLCLSVSVGGRRPARGS
jgi:hypothetical protein